MIASFEADDVAELLPSSPVQLPRRLSHTFARELSSHFLSFLNIQAPGAGPSGVGAVETDCDHVPLTDAEVEAKTFDKESSEELAVGNGVGSAAGAAERSSRSSRSRSGSRRASVRGRSGSDEHGGGAQAFRVLPPSVDRTRVRRTSSIGRRRHSGTGGGSSAERSRSGSRRRSVSRNNSGRARRNKQHVGDGSGAVSPAAHKRALTLKLGDEPEDSHTDCLDDDYFRCRRELRVFRKKLTEQSEVNFRLERKLRHLDERIGLLISHRISVEEIDAKLLDYDFIIHKGNSWMKQW
jgi:hypothetical protein